MDIFGSEKDFNTVFNWIGIAAVIFAILTGAVICSAGSKLENEYLTAEIVEKDLKTETALLVIAMIANPGGVFITAKTSDPDAFYRAVTDAAETHGRSVTIRAPAQEDKRRAPGVVSVARLLNSSEIYIVGE